MPVEQKQRHWVVAIALQLGIRMKFYLLTFFGLKPWIASLTAYPSTWRPKNCPQYDAMTRLGFITTWFTAGFLREYSLLYVIATYTGALHLLNMFHKWVQNYTERQLKASGEWNSQEKYIPIPEYDWKNGNPEEFYELFVKNPHPVILRNFMDDRPLLKDLSWESVMARFAEEDVLLTKKEKDGFPGKLKDVNDPNCYLHNSEILFSKYPNLRDLFDYTRLEPYAHMKVGYEQIFVGREGTGSPFHHAAVYNFFYQIDGEKQWYFVEPYDTFLLYPFILWGRAASAAMCLFPKDFNSKAFPLFRYCPIYSAHLKPGDVLWNPPFWWHSIKNVTPTTVAVASRWHTGGICGGKDLTMTEEDYDIYRIGSLFFFLGMSSWTFLHEILQTPSPRFDEHATLREKKNRYVHHQLDMASKGGMEFGGMVTPY